MTAVANWLRLQWRMAFTNAVAKRDMRVQLRGSKAVWLWFGYLTLFLIISLSAYQMSNMVGAYGSVAFRQRQLQGFYSSVLGLLGGLISLIAPALGATAIVAERERRSLDLVFSTPVRPAYYLFGKLISTYRYIWTLLLLSLPIVSVGVVMGGATWGDVALTFLVMSVVSLILSSLALAISAGSQKITSAIFFSYFAVFLYTIASTSLAATGMSSGTGMTFALFSPFYPLISASGSGAFMGATSAPSMIGFLVIAGFTLFFILLAASSSLSSWHIRETTWLRIAGLVMIALTAYAYSVNVGLMRMGGTVSPGAFGGMFAYATLPWTFVAPFLTCYGRTEPHKFIYDGPTKFRNIFRAAPSGALPYLVALAIAATVGATIAALGSFTLATTLPLGFFLGSLFTFSWGVGRLASRLAGTVYAARSLTVGIIVIFLLMPTMAAGILDGATASDAFTILTPFYGFAHVEQPQGLIGWSIIMLVLAGIASRWAASIRPAMWDAEVMDGA